MSNFAWLVTNKSEEKQVKMILFQGRDVCSLQIEFDATCTAAYNNSSGLRMGLPRAGALNHSSPLFKRGREEIHLVESEIG